MDFKTKKDEAFIQSMKSHHEVYEKDGNILLSLDIQELLAESKRAGETLSKGAKFIHGDGKQFSNLFSILYKGESTLKILIDKPKPVEHLDEDDKVEVNV